MPCFDAAKREYNGGTKAVTTIHWLGAGLSSGPGVRRLCEASRNLLLWNRTPDRAVAVLGARDQSRARKLDMPALEAAVNPGDVVVSMLPADWHPKIAALSISRGAHFVSSSYVSDAMRELDAAARAAGLCLVNEVGLDPGIDHLMAHRLVHRFRQSAACNPGSTVSLRSWCGGFPAVPNSFRYKFSWSPVGVLRALRTPARCISDGKTVDISRPWQAISRYQLPGTAMESFEAYPNRDSLPFVSDYRFDPAWKIKDFVRGTLRLDGWSTAWEDLFATLASLEEESAEETLSAISGQLWQDYAYTDGEADRVVLCVELEGKSQAGEHFHEASIIDATGTTDATAMARLVSLPVSFAVDAILAGSIDAGVSAAPSDQALINQWFDALALGGDQVIHQSVAAS